MSKFKDLAHAATRKVSRQILTAQKHSPTMLVALGVPAVVTAAVLACRATLKLNEVMDEGEKQLELIVAVVPGDEENDKLESEKAKKASFNVKLKTATKIAKLYAPAVIIGVAGISALTGSHVILRRRNAALTAAYAIVDKGFKEYRARVIEDQGTQKDLEYKFGVIEREIVEEGPNGPEVKTIRGLDQEAVKKNQASSYSRVFDEYNGNWSPVPNMNLCFLKAEQAHVNDLLWHNGYVFLNQVYELLGFEPTAAGQQVGWVKHPETGRGDGYISFGLEANTEGAKLFATGRTDSILLDFNVDGNVMSVLKEM